MELQPHQIRVVNELNETRERLQKLDAFIASKSFETIVQDPAERSDLVLQAEVMRSYVSILERRVARFL